MSPNFLGIDVGTLGVASFLESCRLLFALGSVVFLLLLARFGKPVWLLAGVVLANTFVFWVTNYPLQRLYALGPSRDRIMNLGLCQVVATGNSPLRTTQVGQIHFEPFWSALVAALSGWNPDRVLRLYPFLALATACGFALSLFLGLRPPETQGGTDGSWTAWERAVIAAFATLLSSSPLDFLGTYDVPWSLTFLLKPNHALGFVVFPLVLRSFASIKGWVGRVSVGFFLQLLGWVFVLHMVYVAAGLAVFALLSLLTRARQAWRDVLDVAVVLGVNILIVSPYLLMLLVGYPFLRSVPSLQIASNSPHLLETTTRVGWLFPLGVWGVVVAYRRGDRLGRIWVSQLWAGYLIWCGYLILSFFHRAQEQDEIYYWVRILLAVSAGIGAWDLADRCARWWRRGVAPSIRAAALGALMLPWSLPSWWDPPRMDRYFLRSLPPLSANIAGPTEFLRQRTDLRAVVAGDPDYAGWVSALGARRVLIARNLHWPRDAWLRRWLQERLLRESDGSAAREVVARYGVQYLVVTPSLLKATPGVTLDALRLLPYFREVHFSGDAKDFVAIFRLELDR